MHPASFFFFFADRRWRGEGCVCVQPGIPLPDDVCKARPVFQMRIRGEDALSQRVSAPASCPSPLPPFPPQCFPLLPSTLQWPSLRPIEPVAAFYILRLSFPTFLSLAFCHVGVCSEGQIVGKWIFRCCIVVDSRLFIRHPGVLPIASSPSLLSQFVQSLTARAPTQSYLSMSIVEYEAGG